MKEKTQSIVIALFIIGVFLSGLSFVYLTNGSENAANGIYSLTLVIKGDNTTSGNMDSQFSFYTLVNNVTVNSSVIKVPFGVEVKITIINYDSGYSLPLVKSAENVTGTIDNSVSVYNSVSVSSANLDNLNGSQTYTNISASDISHTFTTNTGLNIPIFPHSTEVAYTYFNEVGNYSWACMCECGLPSMESPGSMMGELVVLPP